MRRSAALAPLSRDHHHALVVARELIRAGPQTAASAAARFVEFLADHELAHFDLEEAWLLPALPAVAPGPELDRRVREDHVWLRLQANELAAKSGLASLDALHEIGIRLRSHVRFEENELFPYLEASLSPAELERIGRELSARPG